jgi:hypothetical protein
MTALKPRGNPLASGRPATAPDGAVTVRLHETDGRPTRATVRLATGIRAAWLTDLLEESTETPVDVLDDTAVVDVPAFGTVTLALQVADGLTDVVSKPRPAVPEPVQPVFTRYWLHGKGPAPAGNLPVAVHVSPTRTAITQSGDTGRVRVSVACGPEPASGEVELVVPDGIAVEPTAGLRYDLEAGGYATWDLTVRADSGVADGRYFVGARVRDAVGQVFEDAAMVAVGEPGGPDASLPPEELFFRLQADVQALSGEASLTILTPELRLAPGERGTLQVRVSSHLASELRGEAQLLSPFGTWTAAGPWTQDVRAEPGGSATLSYPVTVPATAEPGQQWWLLVKLMYFGRVRYSEAIRLTVTGA